MAAHVYTHFQRNSAMHSVKQTGFLRGHSPAVHTPPPASIPHAHPPTTLALSLAGSHNSFTSSPTQIGSISINLCLRGPQLCAFLSPNFGGARKRDRCTRGCSFLWSECGEPRTKTGSPCHWHGAVGIIASPLRAAVVTHTIFVLDLWSLLFLLFLGAVKKRRMGKCVCIYSHRAPRSLWHCPGCKLKAPRENANC